MVFADVTCYSFKSIAFVNPQLNWPSLLIRSIILSFVTS